MSKISGKERDVLDTINIVKSILSKAGFYIIENELTNPVKGIWWVNIYDKESGFYTNGKGATRENSLASAYCEFLERVGTGYFFNDYVLNDFTLENQWVYSPDEVGVPVESDYKTNLLNSNLWDFFDADNSLGVENLLDAGTCNRDYIISLPFKNALDPDEVVNFPVEVLRVLYASNGLSAGNSENETLIQGISECIERGVKNHIISEGLSLPDIEISTLEKMGFDTVINDIESYGYSLKLKDASLGGRFPVICALLINMNEGSVLSSFGAHPLLNVAIDRTLTELLQGRKINSIQGFSQLSSDIDLVADESNLESHFINSTGILHIDILKKCDEPSVLWDLGGRTELEYLKFLLENEGYDLFYRSQKIGDMWVSRSIIPGLSEIYPVEDIEFEYRNRTGLLRSYLKGKLSDIELNELLEWFSDSYIDSNEYILDFLGVADDNLKYLACEIEMLVCLKLKNIDRVLDILETVIDYNLIDSSRIGFWKCLYFYLNNTDESTLQSLFTTKQLERVRDSLDGRIPKDLFPELEKGFDYLEKQRKIKAFYKKYRCLFN